MRIFISGVAGFLGGHLADAFLADGQVVLGVDNMIGGYLDNVPAGVFMQCDCNEFHRLKKLMQGVDIAYHCASTAYEALSVFSPHLITQNIVNCEHWYDFRRRRQQGTALCDVLFDGSRPRKKCPGRGEKAR
jgi:nucleoside-diphosphate-sugar epimerase